MESTLRLRGGVLYFFVTGILYFLQVDQSLVFRSVCVVSHSSKRLRFCWFGFGFLAFLESSKFDLVNTLFHCSKLTLCRETFKLPNRFLCLELVPTFSIIRINNNSRTFEINFYDIKFNLIPVTGDEKHPLNQPNALYGIVFYSLFGLLYFCSGNSKFLANLQFYSFVLGKLFISRKCMLLLVLR